MTQPRGSGGAARAGMRVFGPGGRNVQEGEEAQSETGVGNAFWETDGDLFEREPLELGSNFFSNLTLH